MFNSSKNVLRAVIKLFSSLISVTLLSVYVLLSLFASQAISVEVGPAHIQEVTPEQAIVYNHTPASQISPTVLDTTTDTSIVLSEIYLPLVVKHWPPIPYKPSLNAIQGADDGDYTVDWNESPSRLADTYTLQEATDSTFTVNLYEVCTTAQQSCTINGKLAGIYYYRVRGQNSWANSEWSDLQTVNILLPDTPALNVIENADGDGDYTITWGATARATNYILEEDTDATFQNPTTLYSGPEQSWSVTNQPRGTYYYRIKATALTGESPWSNIQSGIVIPRIEVVEHHGYRFVYWPEEDSTWIEFYSEVKNNTQKNVTDVEIVLNVYDNNNTLLATNTDDSMLEVIRPGQTSPVEFYVDIPGGADTIRNGIVDIKVRNNWSYTSEETQNTFELVSHSSFQDSNGARRVVGQAKNIGTTTEDLQVTVSIRGQGPFQDLVLAADYDWVSDVAPGETVSFEELFWKNFGDYYAHYELILEKE